MPNVLHQFGPFVLDLRTRTLLRGRAIVPLTPKEFDTLQCLVENAGTVVSKETLRESIWPRRLFLSDSNLAQHIKALRRKLGEGSEGNSFIKTAVGEGYYLTVPVTAVPATTREPPEPLSARPPLFSGKHVLWSAGAVILAVLGGAGYLITTRGGGLRAIEFRAVTNDGLPKIGPLLSDGHRLFFLEQINEDWKVVSVPTTGGEVSTFATPLPIDRLHDIAADGSSLLLSTLEGAGTKLWSWPIAGGSPRVIPSEYGDAGWAPDRNRIAFGQNTSLVVMTSGGARTASSVSRFARVLNPHWSPDGVRISFTLMDPKNVTSSLWQVDSTGKRWERMAQTAGSGDDQANGIWTSDGRYFVYEAGSAQRHDLWMLPRADGVLASYLSSAFRITNGPLNWKWPAPAKGGGQIFAFGESVRGELVRLDPKTKVWRSYLGGIPAYEIDFSRDGKWITYTRFPEHTIWKMKADGSERVQLTTTEFEAHQPHWSPDGSRIAFMARKPDKPWRVVTLEIASGATAEPISDANDQGVPTWSKDGHSLVFGDWLFVKEPVAMGIHLFDLQTRRLSTLAESANLWTPRWSPDGEYVSALRPRGGALLVARCCFSNWKTILEGTSLDDPMWSPDSKYIFLIAGSRSNSRSLILRVTVPEGRVEEIADIHDFPTTDEQWFGLAPDGSVLGLRGVRVQEIYALDYKL
jgi:Tol biopolymer transport system component/DNA-binding winged helix-turn-helix (wHTH) protein